ncbi:helix-turn-helix domain-containing protein [Azospirillum sp. INR13]|uniref:helix-turn-helix domain-containing protein n=1 Tax=Azospirillum sp. INR13 TaxID=2596919 RepID=UPI00189243EC|nr:helix-turn-helix domain-containing protein [Azospirillum sp. INR13]
MEHASKQRVGLVPARYLDHPDVGVLELGVLTVLSIHADRTGLSWPSQTTIATKLKINRSTANSVLAKLVSLGWLQRASIPIRRSGSAPTSSRGTRPCWTAFWAACTMLSTRCQPLLPTATQNTPNISIKNLSLLGARARRREVPGLTATALGTRPVQRLRLQSTTAGRHRKTTCRLPPQPVPI